MLPVAREAGAPKGNDSRMPRRLFLGAAIVFGAIVAACGGGGSSGAIPRTGTTSHSTSATVRVVIPSSGAARARRPAFISPNTATISIALYTVNGATPSPLPSPVSVTIATSSDCTTSGSATSCTITVTVPVATAVVLQLSTFDANGTLLGESLLGPIDTTLATIPVESVSIGGVPATIVLSPAGLAAGDDGASHPITLGVSAEDASGNTIIPPGAYPNPITLTITGDTNGALSLSSTSVASPGPSNGASTVTVTYNSAIAITQATITASYGTASASVPFAPIVFTPTSLLSLFAGGSMQTVTVSEAGYAGAFNVLGTSSVATVTCVPANCTPSAAGGTVTVDIVPGSAGSETVSIVDANGGFANLPIAVTSSGGGGALVAPAYTIYKYTIGSKLFGITVGPDGQSLWFVDQGGPAIGWVPSPSGCAASCTPAIEETPYPPQILSPDWPVDPQGIVAAPDGNMYIVDPGNGSGDLGNAYQVTCSVASGGCSTGTWLQDLDEIVSTPAPGDVLAGPDGNLYLSSQYDNPYAGGSIYEATVTGCCSFNNLNVASTGPSSVNGLTIDASGQNLWFTDSASGNIGYVNIPCLSECTAVELPSGTTEVNSTEGRHRAGTPRRRSVAPITKGRHLCCASGGFTSPLNGIVAAPDGYIYFAEAGAHQLDRIAPASWESCSGATCVPTPIPLTGSAEPQNLIVGPDGNVWFTDTSGYVGFVSLNSCTSPSGCKVFEYDVGGSPWGIAAGPDGNIWWTDSSQGLIGKVVLQ